MAEAIEAGGGCEMSTDQERIHPASAARCAIVPMGVVAAALTMSALALVFASPCALAGDLMPTRGIVRAIHQASISTEIVTPILSIGFREGERFEAGATLIEFDCRRQRHELEALASTVRETKVAVEANLHLSRRGAANRSDVDVSEAKHDKATAEFKAVQQRLEGCRIAAPFAGVVTELSINAHETPPPNRPLLTIASDKNLEIEMIVPSNMLATLRAGADVQFVVDETRRAYAAQLLRTGGAVDPSSQTAKVYARFADAPEGVLPGMSGSAHFSPRGEN